MHVSLAKDTAANDGWDSIARKFALTVNVGGVELEVFSQQRSHLLKLVLIA